MTVRFHTEVNVDSVSELLRELADNIDNGISDPCVVITAQDEGMVRVDSYGNADSDDVIATITKGNHVMMNAVMPYGADGGENASEYDEDTLEG